MSSQEFDSLVLNNADGLKPFAITLTRDNEAAKDLYQETLCKALAHRDKYQPDTNIKAWLSTIMRNIFINEYRRAGRKKLVVDTIQHFSSNTPFASTADKNVIMREINTAIYNLPGIFKTVCLLYLEGYKYQEIAQALNEPLGTIKSRIHFARKMLKKQISR